MAPVASTLKDKGNVHFKECRFSEAAELYAQAEKAAPQEAVYPSNLSAALYELGDYPGCFQAICRATNNCPDSEANSNLLSRLSLRLAKTLAHGVRRGDISPQSIQDGSTVLERLKKSADAGSSTNTDLVRAWNDWKRVEDETETVAKGAASARTRLSQLPIFRKGSDPAIEYHSVGQDDPMSIIDDWGPQPEEKNPMKLEKLSPSELSNLAFLFGGVGDARHVFSSLIGLNKAYGKLDKTKKTQFNAHLTLLDHHPTALARDLCLLVLLDDLMSGKHTAEVEAEIKATIFYTYMGALMPSYCYQRFQNVAKDTLKNIATKPPQLPSWIHVTTESIPGLIGPLTYWLTGVSNRTASGMLSHHNPRMAGQSSMNMIADGAGMAPHFVNKMKETEEQERTMMTNMINTMPDEKIIELMQSKAPEPCPAPGNSKRAQWLKTVRELIIKTATDKTMQPLRGTEQTAFEAGWYFQTKVFVPPTILRKRHASIQKYWHASEDISKMVGSGTPEKKQIKADVKATWKPNASLFDPNSHRLDEYPDTSYDPFLLVSALEEFSTRFQLINRYKKVDKQCPSYSVAEIFFDGVVDALTAMKGHIKLEILHGDLSKEITKMRIGNDVSRPEDFPRKFMRMWLSNVPDYTHGPINTAVYIMPNLDIGPYAAAGSNCMLNTGTWEDGPGDDYCYNYTLLNVQELPRFLGCRAVSMKAMFGVVSLTSEILPRPLRDLASREELDTWLSRTLLYIMAPGKPIRAAYRIVYPNNLVTFIDLLVHLHTVGFPSHWLSEFLRAIISNTLATNVAPYLGELPVPLSDRSRRVAKRKVNLDPWRVEFETILALSYEAIPFPVSLPDDFAKSAVEIGSFEVYVPKYDFEITTSMGGLQPFDPVMSLMFYKPGEHTPNRLAANVSDIIEGRVPNIRGKLHIVTALEAFDVWKGVIRWKMSKNRVKAMKQDGWLMSAYRYDGRETATKPIAASRWKEI